MIKQTFNNNVYLEICSKLKEVDKCKLTPNTLYAYMLSEDVFTFISEDKDIINGCLVLKLFTDNEGKTSLLMVFIWIDPHYPKLLDDFNKVAEDRARQVKAVRIYFIADRNEKVILRRTGKYGFKKAYTTYRKEVN